MVTTPPLPLIYFLQCSYSVYLTPASNMLSPSPYLTRQSGTSKERKLARPGVVAVTDFSGRNRSPGTGLVTTSLTLNCHLLFLAIREIDFKLYTFFINVPIHLTSIFFKHLCWVFYYRPWFFLNHVPLIQPCYQNPFIPMNYLEYSMTHV